MAIPNGPVAARLRLRELFEPLCAELSSLVATTSASTGLSTRGAFKRISKKELSLGRLPTLPSFSAQTNRLLIPLPSRMHRVPGFIPVGEYGRDLAVAFERAFQALGLDAIEVQRNSSTTHRGDSSISEFLSRTTYMGSMPLTMEDSLGSLAQICGHLMLRRVKGYERRPLDLLEAIVSSGVLDTVAALLPLGALGQMSTSGLTFPFPLIAADGGGVIHLTAEFESLLRHEHLHTRRELELGSRPSGAGIAVSRGCPLAIHGRGQTSGISMVSRAFYRRVVELAPRSLQRSRRDSPSLV